jgi:hypothetical protein
MKTGAHSAAVVSLPFNTIHVSLSLGQRRQVVSGGSWPSTEITGNGLPSEVQMWKSLSASPTFAVLWGTHSMGGPGGGGGPTSYEIFTPGSPGAGVVAVVTVGVT